MEKVINAEGVQHDLIHSLNVATMRNTVRIKQCVKHLETEQCLNSCGGRKHRALPLTAYKQC